jgi:uncharacterized membrane protein YhaH (DUF805 family)
LISAIMAVVVHLFSIPLSVSGTLICQLVGPVGDSFLFLTCRDSTCTIVVMGFLNRDLSTLILPSVQRKIKGVIIAQLMYGVLIIVGCVCLIIGRIAGEEPTKPATGKWVFVALALVFGLCALVGGILLLLRRRVAVLFLWPASLAQLVPVIVTIATGRWNSFFGFSQLVASTAWAVIGVVTMDAMGGEAMRKHLAGVRVVVPSHIPEDGRAKHPGIWLMLLGACLIVPMVLFVGYNGQISRQTEAWAGPACSGIAVGGFVCFLIGAFRNRMLRPPPEEKEIEGPRRPAGSPGSHSARGPELPDFSERLPDFRKRLS